VSALERQMAADAIALSREHADRADAAVARAEAAEAQLEHAKAALADDNEGVRLWMLDCGELVAKHRARAVAAEAKLAEVRARCEGRRLVMAGDILAIIGAGEEDRV